jgi:hypothetical protein
MISSNLPFARLAPIYEEAVNSRFALHLKNRTNVYTEASPQFPQSQFWARVGEVLSVWPQRCGCITTLLH